MSPFTTNTPAPTHGLDGHHDLDPSSLFDWDLFGGSPPSTLPPDLPAPPAEQVAVPAPATSTTTTIATSHIPPSISPVPAAPTTPTTTSTTMAGLTFNTAASAPAPLHIPTAPTLTFTLASPALPISTSAFPTATANDHQDPTNSPFFGQTFVFVEGSLSEDEYMSVISFLLPHGVVPTIIEKLEPTTEATFHIVSNDYIASEPGTERIPTVKAKDLPMLNIDLDTFLNDMTAEKFESLFGSLDNSSATAAETDPVAALLAAVAETVPLVPAAPLAEGLAPLVPPLSPPADTAQLQPAQTELASAAASPNSLFDNESVADEHHSAEDADGETDDGELFEEVGPDNDDDDIFVPVDAPPAVPTQLAVPSHSQAAASPSPQPVASPVPQAVVAPRPASPNPSFAHTMANYRVAAPFTSLQPAANGMLAPPQAAPHFSQSLPQHVQGPATVSLPGNAVPSQATAYYPPPQAHALQASAALPVSVNASPAQAATRVPPAQSKPMQSSAAHRPTATVPVSTRVRAPTPAVYTPAVYTPEAYAPGAFSPEAMQASIETPCADGYIVFQGDRPPPRPPKGRRSLSRTPTRSSSPVPPPQPGYAASGHPAPVDPRYLAAPVPSRGMRGSSPIAPSPGYVGGSSPLPMARGHSPVPSPLSQVYLPAQHTTATTPSQAGPSRLSATALQGRGNSSHPYARTPRDGGPVPNPPQARHSSSPYAGPQMSGTPSSTNWPPPPGNFIPIEMVPPEFISSLSPAPVEHTTGPSYLPPRGHSPSSQVPVQMAMAPGHPVKGYYVADSRTQVAYTPGPPAMMGSTTCVPSVSPVPEATSTRYRSVSPAVAPGFGRGIPVPPPAAQSRPSKRRASDPAPEPPAPAKKARRPSGPRQQIPPGMTLEDVLAHVVHEINKFNWGNPKHTRDMFYKNYEMNNDFPLRIEEFCKGYEDHIMAACPGYASSRRTGLKIKNDGGEVADELVFFSREFCWQPETTLEDFYRCFEAKFGANPRPSAQTYRDLLIAGSPEYAARCMPSTRGGSIPALIPLADPARPSSSSPYPVLPAFSYEQPQAQWHPPPALAQVPAQPFQIQAAYVPAAPKHTQDLADGFQADDGHVDGDAADMDGGDEHVPDTVQHVQEPPAHVPEHPAVPPPAHVEPSLAALPHIPPKFLNEHTGEYRALVIKRIKREAEEAEANKRAQAAAALTAQQAAEEKKEKQKEARRLKAKAARQAKKQAQAADPEHARLAAEKAEKKKAEEVAKAAERAARAAADAEKAAEKAAKKAATEAEKARKQKEKEEKEAETAAEKARKEQEKHAATEARAAKKAQEKEEKEAQKASAATKRGRSSGEDDDEDDDDSSNKDGEDSGDKPSKPKRATKRRKSEATPEPRPLFLQNIVPSPARRPRAPNKRWADIKFSRCIPGVCPPDTPCACTLKRTREGGKGWRAV